MASRLSELLERIRPAGTPGAPGEPTEQSATDELAELVEVLASYDREADTIISAARDEAARIQADADRRIQQIRSEIPERSAIARVAGSDESAAAAEAERDRIAASADEEIERLRRAHPEHRAAVAARALQLVWESAGCPAEGEVAP